MFVANLKSAYGKLRGVVHHVTISLEQQLACYVLQCKHDHIRKFNRHANYFLGKHVEQKAELTTEDVI